MLFRPIRCFWLAGFSLFILLACAEKYPYFIQQPEFLAEPAEDGYPGILLTIACEDEYALIRYTLDGTEPGKLHGLLYEEPLYLASRSYTVKAVAVREGYGEGPVAEYRYEASN